MLSDLPLELVDSIAVFLSYSDLVSLKLTCKRLASQVEFVEARVRRLNVFIDALPFESRQFRVDEPTIYPEALTASPAKILSSAFRDRFRHLKRLTFQQKLKTSGSLVLERDVNCFELLEHLELRAHEINDGGRLRLKELRVLLVETEKVARYVVDCEQLAAFHFAGSEPEIVHPTSLRHASFLQLKEDAYDEFCRKCPNLTRLTFITDAIDLSTLRLNGTKEGGCNPQGLQLSGLACVIGQRNFPGLIERNQLRFLERMDFDMIHYAPFNFFEFRRTCRWLNYPFHRPLQGSSAKEVIQKLSVHLGSQDVVNDENFDELMEVIRDWRHFQKCRRRPHQWHGLSLNLMHYSELIKFQRPMEGLLAGLRFLLVDESVDLGGDQLINRLANLRELRIREKMLGHAEPVHQAV